MTAPAPLTAEQIAEAADAIVDGVYFDLDERVYHACQRLSSSGIQKLCVSAATFWRGSWLDPECPELDEEQTKYQVIGKAYHAARLEPEKFAATYVRALDKADFEAAAKAVGACWTATDIGEALAVAGEAKKKAGEGVAEQGARLAATGYEGVIWPLEKAKFDEALNGRIALDAKVYDEIIRDQSRLLDNPQVAPLFEGGQSEVSIFWTDHNGLKMKARVDRLCATRWLDLKTFDNSRGKVLDQAIADAVRYNRYYIQKAVYRDAIEALRVGGLQIIGDASDEQRKLVARIQLAPGELEGWFIFQEKGGVPNLLARRFKFYDVSEYRETEIAALVGEERQEAVREALSSRTGIFKLAIAEVDSAKRKFVLYSQVYPHGVPWAPVEPVGTIDDMDFNSRWLEGQYQ